MSIPCISNDQCNGRKGSSLTSETLCPDELEFIHRENWDRGVHITPTYCPAPLRTLLHALTTTDNWYSRIGIGPKTGKVHLECFGLSTQPGASGSHLPENILPATPDNLKMLIEASGNRVGIVTLALDAAGDPLGTISYAREKKIAVLLGHQVPTAKLLRKAAAIGFDGLTHFGNAIPPMTGRECFLLDYLDMARKSRGPVFTVICDGIHAREAALRVIIKLAGTDHFVMIADDSPYAHFKDKGQFEVFPGVRGAVRTMPNEQGASVKAVVRLDSGGRYLAGSYHDGLDCANYLAAAVKRWRADPNPLRVNRRALEDMVCWNGLKLLRLRPETMGEVLTHIRTPRFDPRTDRFTVGG